MSNWNLRPLIIVPIVLIGFDYKNRQVIVGETIYASEDEAADFKRIMLFFSTVQGKNADKDLTHLRE